MFRHIVSQLNNLPIVCPVAGVKRNTNPLGEIWRQKIVAEALKKGQLSPCFSQSPELYRRLETIVNKGIVTHGPISLYPIFLS